MNEQNEFYVVNLRHFYNQFKGEFFFWLYLSWDKQYAPKKFRFIYKNEIIDAETEVMYFNTAFVEKEGRNALWGTRNAELLRQAYTAPDFVPFQNKWMSSLMDHIIEYYPDNGLPMFDPSRSPICAKAEEIGGKKTLSENGVLKLLLLRRIHYSKKNAGLNLEKTETLDLWQ